MKPLFTGPASLALLGAVLGTAGCGDDPDIGTTKVSGGTNPDRVACTLPSDTIRIERTNKPDPATCVDNPAETLPRLTTAAVRVGPAAATTGEIPNFFVTWSLCSYNLVNTATTATPYQLVAVRKQRILDNSACLVSPGTPLPASCFAMPDVSQAFTVSALDGCTCQSEMVFFNTAVSSEASLANTTNCPTTARLALPSGSYYVTLTGDFLLDKARNPQMPIPVEVYVP